jgi:hypothetical protein
VTPLDPTLVLEKPNTEPMNAISDSLRRLMTDDAIPAEAKVTLESGAQMIDLVADWLLDQHRMLQKQHVMVDAQNEVIREQMDLIERLKRDRGE